MTTGHHTGVSQADSRAWSLQMFHGKASRPGSAQALTGLVKSGNFGSMLGNKSILRHAGISDPCSSEIRLEISHHFAKLPRVSVPYRNDWESKNFPKCQVLPFLLSVPSTQKRFTKHLPTAEVFNTLWQWSNCWEINSVFQNHGMGWEGP